MDTVERGVANDPRADAGLGRVHSHEQDATKTRTPAGKLDIDERDVEAAANADGMLKLRIASIR